MLKQSLNAAVFSWFAASLCTDLHCQLWSGPEGSIWLCRKVSILNYKDAMFQNFAKGQVSKVDKREAYDACFISDIDWVFLFIFIFHGIKGQHQMIPSMIFGRCVQGTSKMFLPMTEGQKRSHVWRFTVSKSNLNIYCKWRGNVYEEKHIEFRHQDAQVHCTYSYYKASVWSSKEKTPTACTKMKWVTLHACVQSWLGEKLCVVGEYIHIYILESGPCYTEVAVFLTSQIKALRLVYQSL